MREWQKWFKEGDRSDNITGPVVDITEVYRKRELSFDAQQDKALLPWDMAYFEFKTEHAAVVLAAIFRIKICQDQQSSAIKDGRWTPLLEKLGIPTPSQPSPPDEGFPLAAWIQAWQFILIVDSKYYYSNLVSYLNLDGMLILINGKAYAAGLQEDLPLELLTGMWNNTLIAINLCHVKNIILVDHPPSPRLARSWQRRGVPVVSYKTLAIQPTTTRRQPAGQPRQPLGVLPFHLARGHYKDYQEGKGLFGKQHGKFWWEPQARGSLEVGVVKKDYQIKPSKNHLEES